jgi:calmodulin
MGNDDEIISAFATFDNEKNGSIDAEELRRILTSMGDKMSDSEVDDLIKDAGGGSSIDYKEFVKAFNVRAVPVEIEDDDDAADDDDE